jgi:hypothetical protein
LHRQRALVQEQLAWLEREIAALTGTSPIVSPPERIVRPPPAATPLRDVDTVMAELAAEDQKQGPISKQGCWALFVGVMAALGLITGIVVYLCYR